MRAICSKRRNRSNSRQIFSAARSVQLLCAGDVANIRQEVHCASAELRHKTTPQWSCCCSARKTATPWPLRMYSLTGLRSETNAAPGISIRPVIEQAWQLINDASGLLVSNVSSGLSWCCCCCYLFSAGAGSAWVAVAIPNPFLAAT